ncbi:MAG: hypothetical protein IJK31_00580 [Ruminococcus sp.]|nr:hypothetical protein [Ruminococcus sp.]
MAVTTNSEELKFRDEKDERRKTLRKFREDFFASFRIWIKIGCICSAAVILLYVFLRFVLKWDLFYETDLNYPLIFLVVCILLVILIFVCWLGASFLYNTQHRRNTKYRVINTVNTDGSRDNKA